MNVTNHSDFNYSCGVDLHSDNFYFHILDRSGKKVFSGKAANDERKIRELFAPYNDLKLKVAVEIGTPTFWFCDIVNSMAIKTHIVNTFTNSLIAQSTKKTDKIDAKTLAIQLYKDNLPEPIYNPPRHQRELRQLVTQRHQYVKSRAQAINRVHSLLKYNGVMEPKKDLRRKKARQAVRANLPHISDSFHLQLTIHLQTIERLSETIKTLENEMYSQIKKHYFAHYLRLITIPGVALITATSIISVVGDWGRFKSGRKLSAYLGIAPAVCQSNNKMVGSNAITKKGNSLARGYLVQAALGLLKCKDENAQPLKDWYEAMRIQKGWKKARVSLARKLCSIMFGMIKDGTDYDPLLLKKNSKPADN